MGNQAIIWAQVMVNTVLLWLIEVFTSHLKSKKYIPINLSLANAIIKSDFKNEKWFFRQHDRAKRTMDQSHEFETVFLALPLLTVHWTLEKSLALWLSLLSFTKWSDWTEWPPSSFLPPTFCDLWPIAWTMIIGVLCFDILICHGTYAYFHLLYCYSKFKFRKLF